MVKLYPSTTQTDNQANKLRIVLLEHGLECFLRMDINDGGVAVEDGVTVPRE